MTDAGSHSKPPHVLIVGAGVAGLLLAILLKRANITFDIYERAQTVQPLGTTVKWSSTSMGIPSLEN